MSTEWQGRLKFECENTCKCEEKVSFKYVGIVYLIDTLAEETVGTVSLSTQEPVATTYSIKSSFNVEKKAMCENCNETYEDSVPCVLSYTHPITEGTKAMVVVMNGSDHQVVSVPLIMVEDC